MLDIGSAGSIWPQVSDSLSLESNPHRHIIDVRTRVNVYSTHRLLHAKAFHYIDRGRQCNSHIS